MDRRTFRREARPEIFQLAGTVGTVAVRPRETLAGCEWSGSEIVYVKVGGRWVQAKATIVVRAVGSRHWPEG